MRTVFFLIAIILISCEDEPIHHNESKQLAVKSCDLSLLPEIESKNVLFYNSNGQVENMLNLLKSKGMNTVRIRLWHSPTSNRSGFEEVKSFAKRIHQNGMKVWLSVHYSDTWADPGQQAIPHAWESLEFNTLKDSVYNYTQKIVSQIQPDFIQIGNEINEGLLWPQGKLSTNETQFKQILASGITAIRTHASQTKIIIHYAGHENADWFYHKINDLDYDIIGLSYYPLWHGKDLSLLETNINKLISNYNKDIMIAETAYPFTLGWNDWTNNLVGMENQLIDGYPATFQGQRDFLQKINTILLSNTKCLGYCYWGAEFVAFNGPTATDGSPWENQALFDFSNKETPATQIFSN